MYISGEQLLKGDYGLACMYAGYAFANYGAYLIATKWVLRYIHMMAKSLFNGSLI